MKLVPKRISQLGRVVTGKTPPTNRQEFFGGEYPFVTPSDLEYGHYYCRSTERTVTDSARAALPNQFIPAHAVMFTCIGATIGKCALAPSECLTNQQINSVVPNADSDAKFIYYLLCYNVGVVKGLGGGAATPIVSKSKFEEIEFFVPKLREQQQAISFILSAYDEQMENNRRRMGLLEKAARLLYEEWFVRLRFPGHEHCPITQGLPRGWEPVKLSGLIDLKHGYAFAGEHFSDAPTSRVLTTPGSFRAGGGIKIDKPKFYTDEGPLDSDYILASMDLIVTMTDLSVMSDTLGYPAFVPRLDGVSFLHNQRVGKVVPNGAWFPRHFLFHSMCSQNYRQHVLGSATGTAVKHTAPKRILSYDIVMPKAPTLVNEFEATVSPIYRQVGALMQMNEKLRTARDLLLPRLMSGEIEV